tara:strand:+ start:745 stop:1077 length:333 start_codon:yes stop_codon:yes gene_type:complete
MSSNKKIILSLYRIKLRYCIDNFNYKCGSWINYKKINIKSRNLYKLKKKINFGNYIFNIIRDNYKSNKDLTVKEEIDKQIDYGFYIVRNLDEIENIYYGDDIFKILKKID